MSTPCPKWFSSIKKRFDGTAWETIKKHENNLLLYEKLHEKTNEETIKNQSWMREKLKSKISHAKIRFFSNKVADIFYSPKDCREFYSELYSKYLSEQKDSFNFKKIRLPIPDNINEKAIFMGEFCDIILPYILSDLETVTSILTILDYEGPYEIDKNVCLEKNDVVIDCGANMGLFSAVASAKGCIVYSFEPFPYVIEKYLSKTALWNKNINICQYALWDKETTLSFELDYENIGGSSAINRSKAGRKVEVEAIKLDDFIHKNNIPRVDFIKADIEGAERNMLLGGRDVIREFSPKVSICTYHLPDDPKVLHEILLDIQPKYKIQEKFKKLYAYVP